MAVLRKSVRHKDAMISIVGLGFWLISTEACSGVRYRARTLAGPGFAARHLAAQFGKPKGPTLGCMHRIGMLAVARDQMRLA